MTRNRNNVVHVLTPTPSSLYYSLIPQIFSLLSKEHFFEKKGTYWINSLWWGFFLSRRRAEEKTLLKRALSRRKGSFHKQEKSLSNVKKHNHGRTIRRKRKENEDRNTSTQSYKYIATIHKTNAHSDEILSVEISEITLRDETACDKNTLQAVHYYSPCVNFQSTKRCQTVVRPYCLYVPVYNVIDTEILLYLRVERLFQVTKEVLNKVYSGEIL